MSTSIFFLFVSEKGFTLIFSTMFTAVNFFVSLNISLFTFCRGIFFSSLFFVMGTKNALQTALQYTFEVRKKHPEIKYFLHPQKSVKILTQRADNQTTRI